MTTSHSSGRRHRGRRGRRSGNRGAAQQQQAPEQTTVEEVAVETSVILPDLPDEVVVAPVPEQERPQHVNPFPQPGQRPDIRAQRPVRRRPQPRQPVGPMPTEVIKRGLKIGPPAYPLQLRPVGGMIDTSETAVPSNFGCPMLSRSQTALPSSGFQPAPRCSLGWSVHNEDEAMLCMLTPEIIQCWKAHPERIEGLREAYEKDQEVLAAD